MARRLSRSRAATRTGLFLLLACQALFAGSLVLRNEPTYSPLWDGLVGNLALLAATLACFARAFVGGPRRAAALWLGAGGLSYTVANVMYVTWAQYQTNPPVPSPTDVVFLGIYPCIAAAVVCLVRRDGGAPARALWLDGLLGAAGAATALATVLNPVLSGIEGDVAEALVGAAYPIADLLLIAMIGGLLAVRGMRGGSLWLWLAGGLVAFCVADVTYALRVAEGTYALGTVSDALWAVALMFIALAIWRPERPQAIDSGHSTAILAVPMLATLTAVVVLVIASHGGLAAGVVALATFTLLLAVARTFVSFRQVQRLSDARRQAVTDELTGLGNRRYVFEHGEQRLQAADRSERLALLLIDLDNFKEVNDTLGHQAGDQVLRETARRLASRIGRSDLLARLGGDEFALVIALAPDDDARWIAGRILDRVTRPLVIEGVTVAVKASAGIAENESSRVTVAELLRRADVAMYAAKDSGATVETYEPRLDEVNRVRLETIKDLDAALAQRQFVLHYQPKIEVGTGAVVGAEALVRWQHPTRGLLYPDTFLPAVERSGLMSSVTRLVLEAAIGQLATWHRAGLISTVAVNLSPSDLLDERLAGRIERLLTEHRIPATALELEITESVLMTDPGRARGVLEELRRLGTRIAVDDYGIGYSALTYLRDLPIDELKIDRSFVAHLSEDSRNAAIVRSTIELSHALDLKVVAEGVENQQSLDALADLGCDYAQGYHFSRPLPADAFGAWVQARALETLTSHAMTV